MEFKLWLESLELTSLRSYLKNPTLDVASYGWEMLHWKGGKKLMSRLGIAPQDFESAMEEGGNEFYEMADRIAKTMTPEEQDDFLAYLNHHNPGDVPSHSLMSLNTHQGRKGYLPPTTWLVHFSDDAEEVARNGLTQGQGDMSRLALTVHQGDAEKKYGGYNFAFVADSRYAAQSARDGKYGRNAVMFQAAGIPVYHYSDEEDQVIVWGKDVPASRMVLLVQDDGWTVKAKRGRREDMFRGNFKSCVAWVMNNYNQYRKVL